MRSTLWQTVLGEIETQISEAAFSTWFRDKAELVDDDPDHFVIGVANVFAKTQFESKFDQQIRDVLKKNGVTPTTITYTVDKKQKRPVISRETTPSTLVPPAASTPTPSGTRATVNHLNPRYTLDNFIVGSSNDLAYTVAQAAVAAPGEKYNPIYFYGGVGLGKTHLMQAIGNAILAQHPNMRVLYVSFETFVSEFLDHVRYKTKGFSEKYRNVDVLIVDDMQFISGKEKTQEEFFHTFNALHQNNKQIIISSDRPPRSIPTLTDRLRSRFEMGMAIDIQMPDFETRCAIIEAKAALSDAQLDRDTVAYLANNFKTNIRELEGALNQLLAYAEMNQTTPTIAMAEALTGNVRRSRPGHVSAKQIIDRTAKHFGIETAEICGSRRDKHIVLPRQVAMYLLRSELHLSFPKIASELGRKDHTTAIHSVEKITRQIKLDILTREHVAAIREKLYA